MTNYKNQIAGVIITTIALIAFTPKVYAMVPTYTNPQMPQKPPVTYTSAPRRAKPPRPNGMSGSAQMQDRGTLRDLLNEYKGQKLDAIKRIALLRIDRRITRLDSLKTRIEGMEKIPTDVKSQLYSAIEDAKTKLTALKASVQSTTSVEELRQLLKDSMTEYTQLIRTLRQKMFTQVYDRIMERLVERATQINARISQDIQRAKDAGLNTTRAEALFKDALSHYDKAKSLAASLKGETNPAKIKATIVQIRTEVRAYIAGIRAVVRELRSLIPSKTPTPLGTVTVTPTRVTQTPLGTPVVVR